MVSVLQSLAELDAIYAEQFSCWVNETVEQEALIEDICWVGNLDRREFLAAFSDWIVCRPVSARRALELCSHLVEKKLPLPWERKSS